MSYIPPEENGLPPIIQYTSKTDYSFVDVLNNGDLIARLQKEEVKFAIQRNFFVCCKILECELVLSQVKL